MKLFAATLQSMVARYVCGTVLLLAMIIKSMLMYDDWWMCTEGGCENAENYKFWADIADLAINPLLFVFVLFQMVSFYRFAAFKVDAFKASFIVKIFFSVIALFFVVFIVYEARIAILKFLGLW